MPIFQSLKFIDTPSSLLRPGPSPRKKGLLPIPIITLATVVVPLLLEVLVSSGFSSSFLPWDLCLRARRPLCVKFPRRGRPRSSSWGCSISSSTLDSGKSSVRRGSPDSIASSGLMSSIGSCSTSSISRLFLLLHPLRSLLFLLSVPQINSPSYLQVPQSPPSSSSS